jgi:lipopolysaccharide transport system ATP-binding protein
MQTEIVIRLSNVSKVYRQLDHPLKSLRYALFPEADPSGNVALAPINLQVARGEAIGIIGRNGSGKSTLLQLIAGVLEPTTGVIETYGRISALLELGSGFNPEFTGRENVYFSGMVLGLSRSEIDARFDEIAAFAEIGASIDRPVKTYSSGMFVRLAFSVAISVDPDILIIDEALAVGDIYFQQKCFERIADMRMQGTTLFFVSHNSGAVYRFCDRAILLEHGTVALDGSPKDVIETYEAHVIDDRDGVDVPEPEPGVEPSHEIWREDATLVSASVVDEIGNEIHTCVSEDRIAVRFAVRFNTPQNDPHVGFKIRDRMGIVVFETNTYCMKREVGCVAAGETLVIDFPFVSALIEGEYTVSIGVANGGHGEGLFHHQLIYAHDVTHFQVLRNLDSIMWSGVVNLFPSLNVIRESRQAVSAQSTM